MTKTAQQIFKANYSQFRKNVYDYRSRDRNHMGCGDQDAAFDIHSMEQEDFLEGHPAVKAVVVIIENDGDILAKKNEDGWYLRSHYIRLKRLNSKKLA